MRRQILYIVLLAAFAIAIAVHFYTAEQGSHPNVVPNSGFDQNLLVYFLDVNQGDATFIQLPNRKTLLIDAGKADEGTKVARFLRDHNIFRLDAVIASHADSDHIGGITQVVEEFSVGQFYENGLPCDTKTCERLEETLARKNVPRTVVRGGTDLNVGNFSITVLNPWPGEREDNDASIVVLIEYKRQRFLLAADCTFACEDQIVQHFSTISAQTLKVGHHGSKYSSKEFFLKSVSPQYAVISVGENSYGHPTLETLQRLQELNAQILRTDREGDIVFESDGNELSVSVEHRERNS